MSLQDVPEKFSFPEMEEEILKYWEQIKAFETSMKLSANRKQFTFYDGPPFATGLPHYGHLLAGTIKDVITRYAYQSGYHVPRRFGWDCHGLPVEYEIDNTLGIKSPDDVHKMGIKNYNQQCRNIVMRYSSEWEKIVKRSGRWIDFQNDYKTMNPKFMESVWWVFKQLYEKNLIYRGHKVMPYSTGCMTPLSNFEANQNYQETNDPSIYIKFQLQNCNESLIAWTTTPWTLVSNLAICVHPTLNYVQILDIETQEQWILAESRLQALYVILSKIRGHTSSYKVLKKFPGRTLEGKQYCPLFPYFKSHKAFRILVDEYVSDNTGTGVVHQAPAFGEDDYRIAHKAGITEIVCPIDDTGRFTNAIPEYSGQYIKDANRNIIKDLKKSGHILIVQEICHSYPFCWRSDTPLIYRAIPAWFVRVEEHRNQLLHNNEQTRWVPSGIRDHRFKNWLANARDWCISRNRFWGTPIPIWTNDNFSEIICIGSIAELEEYTKTKITDIHRDSIDNLTIQGKTGILKRIPEVFDCWFESGSMPYAQNHYPFENTMQFPADFIAEGIDQTRGWFYTLLVLGTLLFDKAPFKNLIVNGIVQTENGAKMSKRLKNYPDPVDVIRRHGADALRLYLINSPAVRADNLKFREEGVREIVRSVFIPLFNAYRFLIQSIKRFEKDNGKFKNLPEEYHIMDKWIQSSTDTLIKFIQTEMNNYRLYTVLPKILTFIDNLTNWYVRFNRTRMKGDYGKNQQQNSLQTLYNVLLKTCQILCPFTPFLVENIYGNLKKLLPISEQKDSIHYLTLPQTQTNEPRLEIAMNRMQTVILLARKARELTEVNVRTPLSELIVVNSNPDFLHDIKNLENFILSEINVEKITLIQNEDTWVNLKAKAMDRNIGVRFKKDAKIIRQSIEELSSSAIKTFMKTGQIEIRPGIILGQDEIIIVRTPVPAQSHFKLMHNDTTLVGLDSRVSADQKIIGKGREIINGIQQLRRKAGLEPTDQVEITYKTKNLELVFKKCSKMMTDILKAPISQQFNPNSRHIITDKIMDDLEISLYEPFPNKATIELLLGSMNPTAIPKSVILNNQEIQLRED